MAIAVNSKKGLITLYNRCSLEVRHHYRHLPLFFEDEYPMEVAIGYIFHRLELGQRMALYCGLVNIHCADPVTAKRVIGNQHLTRKGFGDLYFVVFNVKLPDSAKQDMECAEATRDFVMHGNTPKDADLRNAIGRVLEYSDALNDQLRKKWKMEPFRGDWRGFSWRKDKLDPRTTHYMLKGMGFGDLKSTSGSEKTSRL